MATGNKGTGILYNNNNNMANYVSEIPLRDISGGDYFKATIIYISLIFQADLDSFTMYLFYYRYLIPVMHLPLNP